MRSLRERIDRRSKLLQRQMVAAGLPRESCYGPNNPVAMFQQTWIASGVAGIMVGEHGVYQRVLPDIPPLMVQPLRPTARSRGCPRAGDTWTPPVVLPAGCLQVFVSPSERLDAFGITMVVGGDCGRRDRDAQHLTDAAARVTHDRSDPLYLGATRASGLHACLSAVIVALEVLAGQNGDAPVVLRVGEHEAVTAVAGVWCPPRNATQLLSRVLRLLAEARSRRGHVWLATFETVILTPLFQTAPHPWGERATALADYASTRGCWGDLPPAYAAARPRAPAQPPWADQTDCPVCLMPYPDLWPTPHTSSRVAPGRWACPQEPRHVVCRSCDAVIQRSQFSIAAPFAALIVRQTWYSREWNSSRGVFKPDAP